MKQKNFKAKNYEPRPNPIALAMCKLGLRRKVTPNNKGYRRNPKHRGREAA